jgi:hypothetical protein
MDNIVRSFAGCDNRILVEEVSLDKLEALEVLTKCLAQRFDLLLVGLATDRTSDGEAAMLQEVKADLSADKSTNAGDGDTLSRLFHN